MSGRSILSNRLETPFQAVNHARHRVLRWIVNELPQVSRHPGRSQQRNCQRIRWQVVRLGANRARGRDATAPINISGRHGLGRSQLRNPVGWRSRRAVPTAQKVPAQTSQVAHVAWLARKVLKELTQGESLYRQVAHEGRQHQKGFRTQGLEPHQQKPRRCRNRGPASQEHQQVGAKVWVEPCNLGRQPVRVAPPTEIQNTVARRSACSCATANTSRKCPECGQVSAENRKSQAKFVCVECAFSAHADFVAAVNIREAGLASLACSQASSDVRASCQEPTEGIPA